MEKPARIAAMKIPVPVAERRLRLKTAASASGLGVAGGIRITRWSSPLTWMGKVLKVSSQDEKRGIPQRMMQVMKIIQGNVVRKSTPCSRGGRARSGIGWSATLRMRRGFQTLKKRMRQMMLREAESTSTSQGPWSVAMRTSEVP